MGNGAPIELVELGVDYVKRVGENEFSSTCPKCGGSRHRNGEYPDRFRFWLQSRTTGGMLGWCRQCGYVWTPRGDHQGSDNKTAETVRKQIEDEASEIAIAQLRGEKAWLRYHASLNGEIRHMLYERGIDDYWIEYWLLGYNPEKRIFDGEGEFITGTITIPIFEPCNSEPVNIRNRLLKPRKPGDKYRPEFRHLPAAMFYANREEYPRDRVILVEGEFKAMTVYLTYDDPSMYVIGVPGKAPRLSMLDRLNDCSAVYILLDPDAYKANGKGISAVRRMIEYFKERSRIITVPDKIDDMIARGIINRASLRSLIHGARRVRL